MSVRLRSTTALFITVGIVIILVGVLSRNATVSAVAANLGVAFIAIPLLDYLWRIAGGNPLDDQINRMTGKLNELDSALSILASGKKVGLEKAFRRLGDYGVQSDWENLIRGATREVDVMGRAAYGWVNSNDLDQLLMRKIQSDGIHFRWLIMSPQNKYLDLLTEEQVNLGKALGFKIQKTRETLMRIKSQIRDDQHHLLEIKEFTEFPLYCAVLRVDNKYYVTPYLSSRSSSECPLLCLDRAVGGWAEVYEREFLTIWSSAVSIESEPGGAAGIAAGSA